MHRLLLVLTMIGVAVPAGAAIRLNEILANVPGGSDTGLEFFELLSTTGSVESLDGLTFITIDGDADVQGKLDEVLSLEGLSTGTNGLFLWAEDDLPLSPTPPAATTISRGSVNLDNDTNTLLLVRGYDGTEKGTDLDTNDDGILDILPWTEVIDAVSWIEKGEFGSVSSYAAQLGGTEFVDTSLSGDFLTDGFTPDALLRPAGFDTWVGMDVESPLPFTFSSSEITRPDGAVLTASDFSDNILSPGSLNVTLSFTGNNSGDYNGDGFVNAADYTVWRDSQGTFVTPFSGADGDGSGQVDSPDFAHWQEHFGEEVGVSVSVPEPTTLVLVFGAIFMVSHLSTRS